MKNLNSIYKITCTKNNKIYVGRTSRGYLIRANEHINMLKKNRHHNKNLQNDFNKYGKGNFKISLLETLQEPNIIDNREKYWIEKLNACSIDNGYNIYETSGGLISDNSIKDGSLFTPGQISKIIGISTRTLRRWCNELSDSLSEYARRKNRKRYFDYIDIETLTNFKELLNSGMNIKEACSYISKRDLKNDYFEYVSIQKQLEIISKKLDLLLMIEDKAEMKEEIDVRAQ